MKNVLDTIIFEDYKWVMETKKLTQDIADQLKSKFGTYDKAARAIGITYRRWCQIRSRDENLNKRLLLVIEHVLNK